VTGPADPVGPVGPVGPDGTPGDMDDFLASFNEQDFASLDFDPISEAQVDQVLSGSEPPGEDGEAARLTAWVRGRVQGVGFRWWVRRNALELGLIGMAENLVDGRVKVVAEGERDQLTELLGRLEAPGSPGHVAQVTHRWDEVRGGFTGFVER
jgi:acylphosphatase